MGSAGSVVQYICLSIANFSVHYLSLFRVPFPTSHHMLLLLLLTTVSLASHLPFQVSLLNQNPSDILQNHQLRHFYIGNDLHYVCAVPNVTALRPSNKETKSDETEVVARAYELIQSSFKPGTCIFAFELQNYYWTYAFCNADKIIQYHEGTPPEKRGKTHSATNPSTVFTLGRFAPHSKNNVEFTNQAPLKLYHQYVQDAYRNFRLVEDKPSPIKQMSQAQTVIMQTVTDGSECDMTGQPRTVEIIYKCDAKGNQWEPQIMQVHEVRTCHYKLVMHVPLLCAYEPFAPNKHHDETVDLACYKQPNEVELTFAVSSGRYNLRDHDFPVSPDNKVVLDDYFIYDLAQGFYLGSPKRPLDSESDYFNHRDVMFFNGFFDSLGDLAGRLGRVYYDLIGTGISSPDPRLPLSWKNYFIVWYELYDHLGRFLGLARLENDSVGSENTLLVQILDPLTLLDTTGDIADLSTFKRPSHTALNGKWNWERFELDILIADRKTTSATTEAQSETHEDKELDLPEEESQETGPQPASLNPDLLHVHIDSSSEDVLVQVYLQGKRLEGVLSGETYIVSLEANGEEVVVEVPVVSDLDYYALTLDYHTTPEESVETAQPSDESTAVGGTEDEKDKDNGEQDEAYVDIEQELLLAKLLDLHDGLEDLFADED